MNNSLALLYCHVLFFFELGKSFILFLLPRRFRKKKDITGQRILITGAGSGLGRQMAIEFSKHATTLVLVDINRKSLLETEKLLDRRSPVFIYDCDVTNYEKVYQMAREVQKDAGDIDILVNNAGIVNGYELMDLPEEKIIKTMEVNALAHFWTCKAFLPPMMTKNEGHIVNICSIAGKQGGPRVTDYCASKFAAIGFAQSLELELKQKKLNGILVTIVCPSVIDTGLFTGVKISIGTIMTPEYVAKEIVAGVLEEKDTIIIPWYFKLLFIMLEIAPRHVVNKFMELTDNINGMVNFTGRTQYENNNLKKKE